MLLAALWVLTGGVVFVVLIRTLSSSTRDFCGIIAAVFALIGLFAWLRDTFLGPKRSTWALLLLITCALIVSVVIWNIVFQRYIRDHGYTSDIFRKVYQTNHAPLYGHAERVLWRHAIWPIIAAGAAIALVTHFRRRFLEGRVPAICFVFLQLMLTVGFSLSDGTHFFRPATPTPAVATSMPTTQKSARELLGDYQTRMLRDTRRLAHYPPGFLLYRDRLLNRVGLRKWMLSINVLLVCLTPLPLGGVARQLRLSRGATQLGLLLFVTAISVLVYTRADFATMDVPLAATSLWLLLRSAHRGGMWSALALGIIFALYTFLSFTAVIAGVLMAFLVIGGLWTGSLKLRKVLKAVGIGAAVYVGIFLALWAWSGFNIYECFQTARANEQMEQGSGFDDAQRYLIRSSGHVIAYLVGAGLALASFALMSLGALRREGDERLWGAAGLALFATILLAGFSGGFHGETERVWLFFTPLLALLAGYEWHRRTIADGRGLFIAVVVVVLLGNCAQELLYKHQSRNLRKDSNTQRVMPLQEGVEFG